MRYWLHLSLPTFTALQRQSANQFDGKHYRQTSRGVWVRVHRPIYRRVTALARAHHTTADKTVASMLSIWHDM